MKHYFIFMAIIFGMIAPSASAQSVKKKVAVYVTGNDVQESYKKVIGSKFVSTITATNEYAAVERTADFLAALSSEQDYQASGEVRDNQIARLGQKFGVRYVVVADVSEMFDELFIASRMINVETGLVEGASEVNGTAESMAQLIDISLKAVNSLIGIPSSPPDGLFYYNIVVASFGLIDDAEREWQLLRNKGYSSKIYRSTDRYYQVIIDGARSKQEAMRIKNRVENEHHYHTKIMYFENGQEKWLR